MAKKQQENPEISNPEGLLPPQAVEVEESVLGSMLIENDAAIIALERLFADDFYSPKTRMIFEAISNLYEGDNPIDILTVESELRDKNQLDTVGGPSYLSHLTRSVSSAANIEYYIQIIKEKSVKRKLINSCTEIITKSYDNLIDPYDLLDQAEKRVFDLSLEHSQNSSVPVGDLVKETLQRLENLSGKNSSITGVPTGFQQLDSFTSGWQPGDMIIIAARPSMGKTAFTLSIARNAALHPDEEMRTGVAVFSLEMSNQSLVQRLLTMEARIDAQAARTGRLSSEDFGLLINAAGRLHKAPIFVDDTAGLSIMELRTKCRRLVKEHNIGMIVIDYLQLMSGGPGFERNREQEIAYISRGLKALAKELDVPVIALSQLSRAVEQRTGHKRPQLSDLRESGSIEQDADVVCFLYRPEYYGFTSDDDGRSTAGLAEVIVGKQRNGPVGSAFLHFVKDYARFENLDTFHGGEDDAMAQLSEGSAQKIEAEFSKPNNEDQYKSDSFDDKPAF